MPLQILIIFSYIQQFEQGYTAPPRLFQYGTAPMNFRYFSYLLHGSSVRADLWPGRYAFRGNWEITREQLHDSQILTLTPSERDTLHHRDDDHSRSKICCRAVAITVSSFLRSSSFCCAVLCLCLFVGFQFSIGTPPVTISVSSSWFFCFFVISFLSWLAGLSSTRSPYSQ